MTLVQLEYILALDQYRHFAAAAAHCHVTQPTLSMQIQKLESEWGMQLFDRSKQPVMPTEMGEMVLQQARIILAEKQNLEELVQHQKGIISGELKVGIIPTLAPYLLPLFIQPFTQMLPHVKLVVSEMTTDTIISRLKESKLDAGIMVTPLNDGSLTEYPMFYEELVAYVSKKNAAFKKTFVLPTDIDPEKLWLLEEGHCFRTQVLNLCELRRASREATHFEYEAGSFETLRRLVDISDGVTILPELALSDFSEEQMQKVKHFKKPAPLREVGIVVHRGFVKKRIIDGLKETIIAGLPPEILKNRKGTVVPV